jgi:hypothetical protein
MNAANWILLGISSAALAGLFGYAFWIPVRLLRLQADLLKIYVGLREKAARLNALNDPAYLRADENLLAAIRGADLFSVPVMLYLHGIGPKMSPPDYPPSADPAVQEMLLSVKGAASLRLANYLIYETLTGRTLWLVMRLLPRKVAKQEVLSGAAGSMDRMRDVRKSLPVGSC